MVRSRVWGVWISADPQVLGACGPGNFFLHGSLLGHVQETHSRVHKALKKKAAVFGVNRTGWLEQDLAPLEGRVEEEQKAPEVAYRWTV